ncbi:MAG: endonuclease/exonuclease/phosphatase family protein [bacterium]|nr:endonuclease/exonuclease/phosphatase family protein [bacterium]
MRAPAIRTALSRLIYGLHPDRPEIGSELLQVKDNAPFSTYSSGQTLRIVSWNTYKGNRPEYRDNLLKQISNADLILLQEFRQSQAFDSFHQQIFETSNALLAVSYYTMRMRISPTGVCTVATAKSLQSIVVTSRSLEPLTRTPKMALCTWYPLNNSQNILRALLVMNCHGINFRLRRSFRDQVSQLREQLLEHTGPIIFVGDFNTWETGREKILDTMAEELHLTRVNFPKGIKHVGGHQLDRVYIRGGSTQNVSVIVNTRASDHALLSFEFTIA